MKLASVPQALKDLQKGKMVILIDDANRENEGDFVFAAEKTTPAAINFMATHGRGLICLCMEETDLKRLHIPLMTSTNTAPLHTAFAVSIEAKEGVTTGSSAYDRAHTIKTAIHPQTTPADIVMPGHVFPLAAKSGGVFVRRGHTEGSIDLMRLAGLKPAAVICEIMKPNGRMARVSDLKILAEKHHIKMISIEQIVQYRTAYDPVIQASAKAKLPLANADFAIQVFNQPFEEIAHVVLTNLKDSQKSPLVRIHSECLTGDVFGSLRCDCGGQLEKSLEMISREGGIFIYLRQEGRGIGLLNKIQAYGFQDTHQLDTVEANQKLGFPPDAREYIVAAQILHKLKIKEIRLLTNNPHKIKELERYGIKVAHRIPLLITPNETNRRYLEIKRKKLGHLFNL